MKQFNDGKNLKDLRSRTYFENYTDDAIIRSEGSWKIILYNDGDVPATLTDGAGNIHDINPVGPGFGPIAMALGHRFGGHQEVIMDDEWILTFDRSNPMLTDFQVRGVFSRIITKKDDSVYPQEVYFQKGGE